MHLIKYGLVLVLAALTGCAPSHTVQSHIPAPPDAPPSALGTQNPGARQYEDQTPTHPLRQIVVDQAIVNIGTPYVWGGASPATGFDCSGLVIYTYAKAGISGIPRTARAQFDKGRPVAMDGILPGDLLFFRTQYKYLHVGIYTGCNTFVHAPGKGRRVIRSSLNTPYFRQHLKGIRSFF